MYSTIRQLYKNKRLGSRPRQCYMLSDSGLLEFSLPTVWKETTPQALAVLSAWLHQGALDPAVITVCDDPQGLSISLKTWKTGKAPSWQPPRRPQWCACPVRITIQRTPEPRINLDSVWLPQTSLCPLPPSSLFTSWCEVKLSSTSHLAPKQRVWFWTMGWPLRQQDLTG